VCVQGARVGVMLCFVEFRALLMSISRQRSLISTASVRHSGVCLVNVNFLDEGVCNIHY